MKKYGFLILLTTLLSCKSSLEKIKTSDNLKNSIGYVTNHINECYEDSNQIDVDEKAEFDYEKKILTIYKGKSINDYFQKWEIPLTDLDPEKIIYSEDMEIFKKVTVFTHENEQKIKYFKNGKFESTTNQSNYYLKDYCLRKKIEKEKFIESYKRAIILSQK